MESWLGLPSFPSYQGSEIQDLGGRLLSEGHLDSPTLFLSACGVGDLFLKIIRRHNPTYLEEESHRPFLQTCAVMRWHSPIALCPEQEGGVIAVFQGF